MAGSKSMNKLPLTMISLAVLLCVSACCGTRTVEKKGSNPLTMQYRMAMEQDRDKYVFTQYVAKGRDISIHFDGGTKYDNVAVKIDRDDSGRPYIHMQHGEGEAIAYIQQQVYTHDACADDYLQCVVLLASRKSLADALLDESGKGVICWLIFRGTEPPDTAYRVEPFRRISARRQDGTIAFELTFDVGFPCSDFPQGSGKITGILGHPEYVTSPVVFDGSLGIGRH
jgi:hypothetical protein